MKLPQPVPGLSLPLASQRKRSASSVTVVELASLSLVNVAPGNNSVLQLEKSVAEHGNSIPLCSQ